MPAESTPTEPAQIESTRTLRIGVLGAAKISKNALFLPVADTEGVEVVAIAARDRSRAEAQAGEYGVGRVEDSYEAVIAADDVDAIYNPLPISLHHRWTIDALRAGKHVLCEKPLASNAVEAAEIVAVASETGMHMIEAFHWRYHPMADRIRALVDGTGPEGSVIGAMRRIDARFNVPIPEADDVRQSWELSGGALMDLGCYPAQWARFVAGSEPTVTAATMTEGRPKVDIRTEIALEFPGVDGGQPVAGHLFTSMERDTERGASLTVEGDAGVLEVTNPIAPHLGNRVVVTSHDGSVVVDEEVGGRSTYHYQLEAFRDLLRGGPSLPTGGDDSIATMKLIDAAYVAAGLTPRGA